MLIDTHAHLSFTEFKNDLPEVLERAKKAGVEKIINVACNFETSETSLEIFKDYENVFLALGIHPCDLTSAVSTQLGKLSQFAAMDQSDKVVAIGEIGLDFFHKPFAAELQKEAFVAQLEIAKKLKLPVIVHSRRAEQETLALIKQVGVKKGVLHCYTGDINTAQEALNWGLHISFNGVVTYPKNEKIREILKLIPLERLLLETDCPYLAPQSKRGQRNEPSFLVETAKLIAKLKEVSFAKLAKVTTENAEKLFNLEVKVSALSDLA